MCMALLPMMNGALLVSGVISAAAHPSVMDMLQSHSAFTAATATAQITLEQRAAEFLEDSCKSQPAQFVFPEGSKDWAAEHGWLVDKVEKHNRFVFGLQNTDVFKDLLSRKLGASSLNSLKPPSAPSLGRDTAPVDSQEVLKRLRTETLFDFVLSLVHIAEEFSVGEMDAAMHKVFRVEDALDEATRRLQAAVGLTNSELKEVTVSIGIPQIKERLMKRRDEILMDPSLHGNWEHASALLKRFDVTGMLQALSEFNTQRLDDVMEVYSAQVDPGAAPPSAISNTGLGQRLVRAVAGKGGATANVARLKREYDAHVLSVVQVMEEMVKAFPDPVRPPPSSPLSPSIAVPNDQAAPTEQEMAAIKGWTSANVQERVRRSREEFEVLKNFHSKAMERIKLQRMLSELNGVAERAGMLKYMLDDPLSRRIVVLAASQHVLQSAAGKSAVPDGVLQLALDERVRVMVRSRDIMRELYQTTIYKFVEANPAKLWTGGSGVTERWFRAVGSLFFKQEYTTVATDVETEAKLTTALKNLKLGELLALPKFVQEEIGANISTEVTSSLTAVNYFKSEQGRLQSAFGTGRARARHARQQLDHLDLHQFRQNLLSFHSPESTHALLQEAQQIINEVHKEMEDDIFHHLCSDIETEVSSPVSTPRNNNNNLSFPQSPLQPSSSPSNFVFLTSAAIFGADRKRCGSRSPSAPRSPVYSSGSVQTLQERYTEVQSTVSSRLTLPTSNSDTHNWVEDGIGETVKLVEQWMLDTRDAQLLEEDLQAALDWWGTLTPGAANNGPISNANANVRGDYLPSTNPVLLRADATTTNLVNAEKHVFESPFLRDASGDFRLLTSRKRMNYYTAEIGPGRATMSAAALPGLVVPLSTHEDESATGAIDATQASKRIRAELARMRLPYAIGDYFKAPTLEGVLGLYPRRSDGLLQPTPVPLSEKAVQQVSQGPTKGSRDILFDMRPAHPVGLVSEVFTPLSSKEFLESPACKVRGSNCEVTQLQNKHINTRDGSEEERHKAAAMAVRLHMNTVMSKHYQWQGRYHIMLNLRTGTYSGVRLKSRLERAAKMKEFVRKLNEEVLLLRDNEASFKTSLETHLSNAGLKENYPSVYRHLTKVSSQARSSALAEPEDVEKQRKWAAIFRLHLLPLITDTPKSSLHGLLRDVAVSNPGLDKYGLPADWTQLIFELRPDLLE